MSIVSYPDGCCLEEKRNCVKCKGKLHRHGVTKRGLQRYLCYWCRVTYTVMNENMLPYKHYSASEIEAAIEDIPANRQQHQMEDSTVRRWRNETKHWLHTAYGLLLKWLNEELKSASLGAFRTFMISEHMELSKRFATTLEIVYWISHTLRV